VPPTDFPNAEPVSTRLDGVDLLRGLAIFFVLMHHVNMRLVLAKVAYTHGLSQELVTPVFWNGQLGVQMFFAVSGFLITSLTLRRWGSLSEVSIRGFYLMRFARIAPLLFLLLAVLCTFHFAGLQNFVVSSKTGGLWRALVAVLTFHVNVLEAQRGYLPGNWDVLWSLSVEEVFYFAFPLVARIFGRGKWLVLFLFGFVALGPFARTVWANGNETWREYSYLGGMDAVALGCLTALLLSRHRFSRAGLWTLGILGTAILIFSLCFSVETETWGLYHTGLDMTILALGTCMFIAAVAQTMWKGPRVIIPILKLGQSSYEVYLTHMFVVFGLFQLFVLAGKPMRAVPALFIVVVAIASLLGAMVARFYSEPINRFIRQRWGTQKNRFRTFPEAREH
jgi:peptidoglycan/LPS O-acetylase OafA/YrhL